MYRIWKKIPPRTIRIYMALLVLCLASVLVKYLSSPEHQMQGKTVEEHSQTLSKYTFAGEVLPFDSPPILKRYKKELNKNRTRSKGNLHMIKAAARWFPLIEPILKKHGIPNDFKYIAAAESKFVQAKSVKGAGGFWQMMPGTARELGLEVNDEVDERYNVMKSTEVVCRFFKQNYKIFGDWTSVVIAYNMGTYGLLRLKKFQKMDNIHFIKSNRETERYFFLVMASKDLIEHPGRYGYRVRGSRHVSQVKVLVVQESIADLARFCAERSIAFATLQGYNPWLRGNSLTIKPESKNKSYTLILPVAAKDNTEGFVPDSAANETTVPDTAVVL
jgi:membrane-bound lytic murein transglycosylase D